MTSWWHVHRGPLWRYKDHGYTASVKNILVQLIYWFNFAINNFIRLTDCNARVILFANCFRRAFWWIIIDFLVFLGLKTLTYLRLGCLPLPPHPSPLTDKKILDFIWIRPYLKIYLSWYVNHSVHSKTALLPVCLERLMFVTCAFGTFDVCDLCVWNVWCLLPVRFERLMFVTCVFGAFDVCYLCVWSVWCPYFPPGESVCLCRSPGEGETSTLAQNPQYITLQAGCKQWEMLSMQW